MPLEVHYPGDVSNMNKQSEWVKMPYPMLVDSGAADTIIPTDWFVGHEIRESEGSRLGA